MQSAELSAYQGTSDATRAEIAAMLAEHSRDPLGFCLIAFQDQPRSFQREVLALIRDHLQNPETRFMPCKIAIRSGHGIGKTALMGMLTVWALTTCDLARAEATAGTGQQLFTKTVPEIQSWVDRAAIHDWFEVQSRSIRVKESPNNWRADFLTWEETNPQAFAGLHNKGRRVLIMFDEASTIPEEVWQAKFGSFTDSDTEIIMLAFSQDESTDSYFDSLFGKPDWKCLTIDSRDVEGTNLALFEEWAKEYGEDSDFFRVRVRGLPPRARDAQFIDRERIELAQRRRPQVLADEPLIAGVDMAWGGDDNNVVRFRRGLDAFSIPAITIPGEKTRDAAVMVNLLGDVLSGSRSNGIRPTAMFVDSAGIAGPVCQRLRALGHTNVVEVNFGAFSPDQKYANMRSYMWGQCKEWLLQGGIPSDHKLLADLIAPGYSHNKQVQLLLEKKEDIKKRLKRSPDAADALCLTFAHKVGPVQKPSVSFRKTSTWS